MRIEGLLVGGSSGSALCGALKWLRSEKGKEVAGTEGTNVVVLLPDGFEIFYCISDVVRLITCYFGQDP